MTLSLKGVQIFAESQLLLYKAVIARYCHEYATTQVPSLSQRGLVFSFFKSLLKLLSLNKRHSYIVHSMCIRITWRAYWNIRCWSLPPGILIHDWFPSDAETACLGTTLENCPGRLYAEAGSLAYLHCEGYQRDSVKNISPYLH